VGREDWYRNTTWTPQTAEAFRARLRRSRTDFHKAQYLRIQGTILASETDPDATHAGIELLEEVLSTYPQEEHECLAAATDLGLAHARLGQADAALRWFEDALTRYNASNGGLDTGVHRHYGMLIVALRIEHKYRDALRHLRAHEKRHRSVGPPSERFAINAIKALIADHFISEEQDEILALATAALKAAAARHSGLARHPTICLVDPEAPITAAVLERLHELVDRRTADTEPSPQP